MNTIVRSVPGLAAVLSVRSVTTRHASAGAPTHRPSPALDGAGAFIPLARVNGVFGTGGTLVSIGGAGAFIPSDVLPTETDDG